MPTTDLQGLQAGLREAVDWSLAQGVAPTTLTERRRFRRRPIEVGSAWRHSTNGAGNELALTPDGTPLVQLKGRWTQTEDPQDMALLLHRIADQDWFGGPVTSGLDG